MGSVEKQSNGRWRARYRDPLNRTRSRTFDRKIDAQRFLERAGSNIQRGDWLDPRLQRTRFADWAAVWWETTAKLRPTTRRGYHQLLHNQVLPYFGQRPLASIDYVEVERVIADWLNDGSLGPKRS